MAIQIPNPGTGNGATGDNEYVLWSKVKDNFSNTTHAASRLVGSGVGNLVENQTHGIGNMGWGGRSISALSASIDINDPPSMNNAVYLIESSYFNDSIYADNLPLKTFGTFINLSVNTSMASKQGTQFYIERLANKGRPAFYYRVYDNATPGPWVKIYTDQNTTIVNGNLRPSSPVVKIHTDSLELNSDAVKMGVTLNKRGVGDYLLQNTTGMRSDGCWRIELPQDVNGNPYFAVAYNELENNDIEVKTYKRIFDMNTFMFGPDLDSPVDIKEGRSIAIRFNDLPLDDTQTEV